MFLTPSTEKIIAVKLIERIDVNWTQLFSYVDKEKRYKLNKFTNFVDARRSLVADILVRIVTISYFGCKNKDIIFDYNEFGKPILRGEKDFHFNISHSGDWIVVGFSKSPIGVDIEKIVPIDLDIASSFFTNDEYVQIMSREGLCKVEHFFAIWTAKESYLKAIGMGLSIPLDSFSVRRTINGVQLESNAENEKCFFREYNFDPRYKMTVCTLGNTHSQSFMIINELRVYNEMFNIEKVYNGGGF